MSRGFDLYLVKKFLKCIFFNLFIIKIVVNPIINVNAKISKLFEKIQGKSRKMYKLVKNKLFFSSFNIWTTIYHESMIKKPRL
jgi:hypothetical protein